MILPDKLVVETTVSDDNVIVLFGVEDGTSEITFDIIEGAGSGALPPYHGPYIITPRKVEQILETDNKRMTDDVTVEKISYIEVGNVSGGLTATIGFE